MSSIYAESGRSALSFLLMSAGLHCVLPALRAAQQ